jgi:hypothetical protein
VVAQSATTAVAGEKEKAGKGDKDKKKEVSKEGNKKRAAK